MKVNFQTAYMPKKMFTTKVNSSFSSPLNYASKVTSDSFVKSQPTFKGELDEVNELVVSEGKFGLIKNLAVYVRSCGYANGRKMPLNSDIDEGFERFFLLCACSSSTYSPTGGYDKYPNKDEFREIIGSLYRESKGEGGSPAEKFITPEILKKKEYARTEDIRKLIREDFARAIKVYGKKRYGINVRDEASVARFADAVYKDKTAQTIKKAVSESAQREGRRSEYFKMLEEAQNSKDMLDILEKKKKVYFSEPKSLEDRYDDYWRRIVNERWYAENAPDDTRSTFEIALDVANGMPW